MRWLEELAGAALGSIVLWVVAIPILSVAMIGINLFFEMWLAIMIIGFPIYVLFCIGQAIYNSKRRE